MVFCASLAPCIRLKSAADSNCRRLNSMSTRAGAVLRNSQNVAVIIASPTLRPIRGATTMNTSVLVHPDQRMAGRPALATAAPPYPPNSAWDELVGRP